jgi:hypothetical protein
MTPEGRSVSETYCQGKNDTVFEPQCVYRFPTYRQNNAPPWGAIHIPLPPKNGQLFGFAGGHSVTVAKVATDWLQRGCPRTLREMTILSQPLLIALCDSNGMANA